MNKINLQKNWTKNHWIGELHYELTKTYELIYKWINKWMRSEELKNEQYEQ